MTQAATATAHLSWDKRWSTDEGRADWVRPEPAVLDLAARLRLKGFERALDLGCGVGRHALAFAALGYDAAAQDMSEAGLAELAARAEAEGLTIDARRAPMTDLPFDDAAFDYVLAFNVIYHGDRDVVAATIAEVARVLRPGGVFQATMLSHRNANRGVGREVSPGTWVDDAAPEGSDKNHPHFFCDARDLVALLDAFDLRALEDEEQKKPGAWHWRFVAERH